MAQSNLARAARQPGAHVPSRPVPTPAARPAGRGVSRAHPTRTWPIAAFGVILITINLIGLPYYLADSGARVRHPWHQWFRPSGYVGQTAGIVALATFIFLWLYPLRKRWKALAFTGAVGRWLDVHVASALWLPLLLAIHAAWRSEGLIGLGFDAMMVVWVSGLVGRYLYTRIPRARSGVELTREEVGRQREELVERIGRATGLSPAVIERSLDVEARASGRLGLWRVFSQLVLNDVRRWQRTRQLKRRWAAMAPDGRRPDPRAVREAVRLASREIALTQQSRMLDATHRVFRFWHVAHRPFAITALLAVVIHVAVVVAVGATWFH